MLLNSDSLSAISLRFPIFVLGIGGIEIRCAHIAPIYLSVGCALRAFTEIAVLVKIGWPLI